MHQAYPRLIPRESASFTSARFGQRRWFRSVTWHACVVPPRADTRDAASLSSENLTDSSSSVVGGWDADRSRWPSSSVLPSGSSNRTSPPSACGGCPVRVTRTPARSRTPTTASMSRGGKLPGTLRRSSKEAQETFTEAHDSAVQTHGDGDQEAYAALKHKFEKRGDHWIAKEPSDRGD